MEIVGGQANFLDRWGAPRSPPLPTRGSPGHRFRKTFVVQYLFDAVLLTLLKTACLSVSQ